MLSVMITANEALLHFNLGSASGVGSSGNKDEDSETEEDSEDTCNSAPDKEAADEFSMQYYEEDLHHLFGEIFKVGTLWFQIEDTVLLIGTLLLFDPVLFPKYEA